MDRAIFHRNRGENTAYIYSYIYEYTGESTKQLKYLLPGVLWHIIASSITAMNECLVYGYGELKLMSLPCALYQTKHMAMEN